MLCMLYVLCLMALNRLMFQNTKTIWENTNKINFNKIPFHLQNLHGYHSLFYANETGRLSIEFIALLRTILVFLKTFPFYAWQSYDSAAESLDK